MKKLIAIILLSVGTAHAAAPIADMIQLPLDTGNTGKKNRTETMIIGANTVHVPFVVPVEELPELNNFRAYLPPVAIPITAQNGNATGAIWVYNPVGSAIKMRIRKMVIGVQFVALAVDLLGGDLRISKFTFTGVNSGAQITPVKMSNATANVGQVASAWATAAATVGATYTGFQLPTMGLATGGAGIWLPQREEFTPDAESDIILLAGEGLVVWNASGVTTANRKVQISVEWKEHE